MATTNFTTNLALALPTTGDLSGTWGLAVNTGISELVDQALGYQAFTATGGSDTLTIPDAASGVARSIYIQLNGTGGGTVNVPTTKTKMYFVFNNTASAITFKVTGQTGVSVPASAKISLVSNGTDIIIAQNYFPALTLGAALPVASGGTGTSSTTFTNLTTNVTGTLPIANGGTGTSSTTFANLTTNVTGILPVVNGGTNLSAGTSGGVLAYTASGTLASSAALAANKVVIGGGAGVVPSTTTLLGTAAAVTTGDYIQALGYADTVTALGNTGTAKNIDITSGGVFTATLTGNCTFTLRFPVATGASSFVLILTNDATASRTVAFTGGTIKFPGGSITRTTTANAVDIYFFFTPDGGTTYFGSIPMANLS